MGSGATLFNEKQNSNAVFDSEDGTENMQQGKLKPIS
jgi:hypothetical protein